MNEQDKTIIEKEDNRDSEKNKNQTEIEDLNLEEFDLDDIEVIESKIFA